MSVNPDDDAGDQPDTIDGRLSGIAQLIDTFPVETGPGRRELRRLVVLDLVAELRADLAARIAELLDRLPAR